MERIPTENDLEPVFSGLKWWQKAGLAVLGVAGLAFLGWLTDDSGTSKKRLNKQELSKLSTQEQQKYLQQQIQQMTPQEQQEYLQELMSGASEYQSEIEKEIDHLFTSAEKAKVQGDMEKAEMLYLKALSVLENDPKTGPDHLYTGLTYYQLGTIYRLREDNEEAEKYLIKALPILELIADKPPDQNPLCLDQYGDTQSLLGDIFLSKSRYEDAEPLILGALQTIEKKGEMISKIPVIGEEEKKMKDQTLKRINAEYAIVQDSLTKLRWKQNKFEEAEELGKKTVKLLKAISPTMEITVRSQMRLVQIFFAQNKYKEGYQVQEELLQDLSPIIGNTPTIGQYIQFFASNSFEHGKYEEAIKLWKQSNEIFLRHEKIESSNVALNNISTTLRELGKIDEAEEILAQLEKELESSQLPPPLTTSKYLSTQSVSISKVSDEAMQFNLIVDAKNLNRLPGSLLLAIFDDASNEKMAISTEAKIEKGKQIIQLDSPTFAEVKKKYYRIRVDIFSDETKQEKIGTHIVLCRSPLANTANNLLNQIEVD